jgi:hypothetical protein
LLPVIVIPVILSDALPLLVSVTVLAVLLVPTICEANVKLVGDRVTAGADVTPVPVSETVCGLPLALSAIETEAVRVPEAVGLKVMLIEQLAPAATLDPQLSVSL